jgi:hypothetical protein
LKLWKDYESHIKKEKLKKENLTRISKCRKKGERTCSITLGAEAKAAGRREGSEAKATGSRE